MAEGLPEAEGRGKEHLLEVFRQAHETLEQAKQRQTGANIINRGLQRQAFEEGADPMGNDLAIHLADETGYAVIDLGKEIERLERRRNEAATDLIAAGFQADLKRLADQLKKLDESGGKRSY